MPIDAKGHWYPLLSPKQILAYNDLTRFLLLSGPRYCGKSIVALHMCVKHAFSNPNARVGIFLRSTKVGKTGVWSDLTRTILPAWESDLQDDGFKVTVPDHVDGATRMSFTRIENVHGSESEIQLHSVHHDEDLESKFKSTAFSMMFFDELDTYRTKDIFLVSKQQLRLPGIPFSQHQWLGVCNPPEEGTDSWIYQRWFVEAKDRRRDEFFRSQYNAYNFTVEDNMPPMGFGEPDIIANLKEDYRNDPERYDRFVLGKWTASAGNSIFAGAFRPMFHIKGDGVDSCILPSESCHDIVVGSDIGDRNHAVSFLEHVHTLWGSYWVLLDEIVHLKEDISLEQLTHEMLGKMHELEQYSQKKINFIHWSDRSALDSYRSASDAPDHVLIHRFSDGKISLQGCPKAPSSIGLRAALVRRLLTQNKLFISGNCKHHIDMFKKLRKGTKLGETVNKRDEYKHCFDSMSYALYGELVDDLLSGGSMPTEKDLPEKIRSL